MADPLSITASIITVLDLTKHVIQYVRSATHAAKDRQDLLSELSSTAGYLYMLKDTTRQSTESSSHPSALQALVGEDGPLEQFKASLEQLAAKLKPSGRSRTATKMIWPFQRSQVAEILVKIERQKTSFMIALEQQNLSSWESNTAATLEMNKRVEAVGNRVDDILCKQLASEDQRVLDWLSTNNAWTKHHDIADKRVEGTGQWILEMPEVIDWMEARHRVLWWSGIPGAGKTMLVAQTCEILLSEIIKHLVLQNPKSLPHVREMCHQHRSRNTRPRLKELWLCLEAVSTVFTRVYLVIDALDECSEDTRRDLTKMIRELPPIYFTLVTSRPIDMIQEETKASAKIIIKAQADDLAQYMKHKIRQSSILERSVSADPKLEERIINALLAEAHGIKRNKRDIAESLDILPKQIDFIYDDAMTRIGEQNDEDQLLAKKILSWTVFCSRPLSIRALQIAISLRPEDRSLDASAFIDEDVILSACGGLLVVETHSGLVHLVHHTAYSFLVSIREIHFASAQIDIGKTCLQIASMNTLEQLPTDHEYFEGLIALFHYAVNSWGFHIVKGGFDLSIESEVLSFLEDEERVENTARQLSTNFAPAERAERHEISQSEMWGCNCLHLAAYFCLPVSVCAALLNQVSSQTINEAGLLGMLGTPLSIALKCGHKQLVKLLVQDERTDLESDNDTP
ncbi:uncharacterized protein KY384_002940 [Bacidia gigantensis]|uniref:uncharacterized protein n=1 Tax=Bacidia gigantensis TaxID=2732470 RepID=UPI001D059C00|nr:uncharacterized protein KY384_002940 [Bacidia gigantensis]KAG8531312.1 hypothetical protein KY384_002940 [Bacidia gigantensis]